MMNNENTALPKLSFLTKLKMAVVGGVILCAGFMTSLFVLAISAIMFPFMAIGMWLLQKRVREQFEENMQATTDEAEEIQPEDASHAPT